MKPKTKHVIFQLTKNDGQIFIGAGHSRIAADKALYRINRGSVRGGPPFFAADWVGCRGLDSKWWMTYRVRNKWVWRRAGPTHKMNRGQSQGIT